MENNLKIEFAFSPLNLKDFFFSLPFTIFLLWFAQLRYNEDTMGGLKSFNKIKIHCLIVKTEGHLLEQSNKKKRKDEEQ